MYASSAALNIWHPKGQMFKGALIFYNARLRFIMHKDNCGGFRGTKKNQHVHRFLSCGLIKTELISICHLCGRNLARTSQKKNNDKGQLTWRKQKKRVTKHAMSPFKQWTMNFSRTHIFFEPFWSKHSLPTPFQVLPSPWHPSMQFINSSTSRSVDGSDISLVASQRNEADLTRSLNKNMSQMAPTWRFVGTGCRWANTVYTEQYILVAQIEAPIKPCMALAVPCNTRYFHHDW